MTEPLLNVADYFCWALQRLFERGEARYCDFIQEKITTIVEINGRDKDWGNYYESTQQAGKKISPPLH